MRVVLLAALTSACAAPPAPAADDPLGERHAMVVDTPASAIALADPELRFRMWRRFDDLRSMENLLVTGKLDEATHLAYVLTRSDGLAEFAHLDDAAQAVQHATSLDQALQREPRIDAACAECHERTHSRVRFEFHGAPNAREVTARHAWAVERLREGVVGPDRDRWRAGLEILAAEPGLDARWVETSRMQALARGALADPSCDPAIVYGDLLATCAACHATR